MDETLVTLPKAARRLGVTATWLKTEAKAGRVPCLPAGPNRYLFDIEALTLSLRDRAAGKGGVHAP